MAENESPIVKLGRRVTESVHQVQIGTLGSVDAGMFGVNKNRPFEITAEEFVQLIKDAEQGHFADMPMSRLKEGPGYMEFGGWLGDQGLAILFMGLGQFLGQWEIVTPRTLGIMDPTAANHMMGMGFLMVSPKMDAELFADAS